jgi:hypothetical protein
MLTMHAPFGVWGVHCFMYSGHCGGLILPSMTWWHLQPGYMSLASVILTLYLLRVSYSLYSGLRARAEAFTLPNPRHPPSTTSNAWLKSCYAFLLPS